MTKKTDEDIEYKMKIDIIPFFFTSTNTWQILKENKVQAEHHIYIQKGSQTIEIKSHTIAYLYIECKIVSLITFDGNNYVLNQPLSYYEEILESCFFRINRQCIVNKNNILQTIPLENSFSVKLKMPKDKIIPITKRKEKEFLKWIKTTPHHHEIKEQ